MGKGVKAFKQGMGEGEDEGLAELEDGGTKPKKRAREAVHEDDEV
jgi:Sec-independent protein translocase protein TatA